MLDQIDKVREVVATLFDPEAPAEKRIYEEGEPPKKSYDEEPEYEEDDWYESYCPAPKKKTPKKEKKIRHLLLEIWRFEDYSAMVVCGQTIALYSWKEKELITGNMPISENEYSKPFALLCLTIADHEIFWKKMHRSSVHCDMVLPHRGEKPTFRSYLKTIERDLKNSLYHFQLEFPEERTDGELESMRNDAVFMRHFKLDRKTADTLRTQAAYDEKKLYEWREKQEEAKKKKGAKDGLQEPA